jgi:hypothetical protein
MTKKQITPVKAKEPPPNLMVRTRMAIHPRANAAAVIQEYCKPFGELDFVELMTVMAETSGKVLDDDMKPVESMLIAQALALQSMFMNFSRKAISTESHQREESYFRMALKAQNQCRMTLETLANIKNPPIVYAKQANIAHGHQQVNNGIPATAPAHEKKSIQSNELLEHQHGEWMDTGTAGTASGFNQELEAVGKIDRRKD